MKDLKHIRRFNESEENLNISDVSDSKKYVYKYNHNGKDFYFEIPLVTSQDDDPQFVSDINDATIFTGKKLKSFVLTDEGEIDFDEEIFFEGEGWVELTKKPVRIEV